MTSFERWQRPMSISCGSLPFEVAPRVEVGDDAPSRLVPVQPGVAVAGLVDRRVVGEDRDHRQVVALRPVA